MRPAKIALPTGDDGVLHGFSHEDGILSGGDAGVHENGVVAEFEGECGVGGERRHRRRTMRGTSVIISRRIRMLATF